MPKYIKTPSEIKQSYIARILKCFENRQRERALREKVEHLERVNGILMKRLERGQKRPGVIRK